MVGVELCHRDGSPATAASLQLIKSMRHPGFILLPEGEHANVISFSPPLTIRERELAATLEAMQDELARLWSREAADQ